MVVIMMVIGTNIETSSSDDLMNDDTKKSLQGEHAEVGFGIKPVDMLALRLGYNYVSPMFKEGADRDRHLTGNNLRHLYRLYQLEGD